MPPPSTTPKGTSTTASQEQRQSRHKTRSSLKTTPTQERIGPKSSLSPYTVRSTSRTTRRNSSRSSTSRGSTSYSGYCEDDTGDRAYLGDELPSPDPHQPLDLPFSLTLASPLHAPITYISDRDLDSNTNSRGDNSYHSGRDSMTTPIRNPGRITSAEEYLMNTQYRNPPGEEPTNEGETPKRY